MQKKFVTILAIETSCDETAASVLRADLSSKEPSMETLSSVVKSQIQMHSKFGGVVPEVAARAHVASIRAVVEKALESAFSKYEILSTKSETNSKSHLSAEVPKGTKVEINSKFQIPNSKFKTTLNPTRYPLNAIDVIAVTAGPGLIMSLLVGVEFAKALSFATGIPLVPVNHMEGHLYSPFGAVISNTQALNPTCPPKFQRRRKQFPNTKKNKSKTVSDLGIRASDFPLLSVVVSGGHTLLVLQKDEKHYKVLGSTVDDAAGEAFDKVAKLLDLPYPGGPEISRLASQGEPNINFPRPMLDKPNFDFSFSGLKTAVLYYLQEHYPVKNALKGKNKPKGGLHHYNFGHIPEKDKANIARSFEEAVCDVLVTKAMRAVKKYNCKTVSLSGGVAANKRLRSNLEAESSKLKAKFLVPDFKLCTDNAEMIAIAGYMKLRAGYTPLPFYKTQADASWEI